MQEWPYGPCAVMLGPCMADTDCIGDNMVCSDTDTCVNFAPCCQMGTVVNAGLNNPDLSTLVCICFLKKH